MALNDAEKLEIQHRVGAALKRARQGRYPVVLVVGSGRHMDWEFWRRFAELEQLAFVDMLEPAQDPGFARIAYVWPSLVDWIRERAIEAGGVVVFDVDALATRWDDSGRERFFAKLLRSETRRPGTVEAAPIVLVSSLAARYQLPENERERGEIVWLIEDDSEGASGQGDGMGERQCG